MACVNIENGRYTIESLYQWDKNQELKIYGLSLPSNPEVHFVNCDMDRAIVRQASMDKAGVITVEVPNALLQKPYKINAYIGVYEGKSFRSLYMIVIKVEARPKPCDYSIEGDDDVYSFKELENKINNLSGGYAKEYASTSKQLTDIANKYSNVLLKLEGIEKEQSNAKGNVNTNKTNIETLQGDVETLKDKVGEIGYDVSAFYATKMNTNKAYSTINVKVGDVMDPEPIDLTSSFAYRQRVNNGDILDLSDCISLDYTQKSENFIVTDMYNFVVDIVDLGDLREGLTYEFKQDGYFYLSADTSGMDSSSLVFKLKKKRYIITSPNGNKFALIVSDTGELSTVPVE